jgi:flavin reductase (DIM6/NTAB) family NADH-FMN oxidoreductase RutF
MAKIKIGPNVFLPMPVVLVGANVEGKANFMAAGWVTRANYEPPLVAVCLDADHHTSKGIEENGTFSLCFPGRDLAAKADYCGLVSGKDKDKSGLFDVFYGDTGTAPMVQECPFCVECRLVKTVPLTGDNVYVGEMVAVYAEEGMLLEQSPDVKKMDLIFLTMPDNKYWVLGDEVADAYSIGESLM